MANILIIDDQPCVQELISQELEKEGHRIRGVEESSSIPDQLASFHPDVVLLDLYLSGFEGWDVLDNIKHKEPNLPVVIFTAYDTFRDDPRLSQADGYVVKSFVGLDELKEKISQVLRQRKPQLKRDLRSFQMAGDSA